MRIGIRIAFGWIIQARVCRRLKAKRRSETQQTPIARYLPTACLSQNAEFTAISPLSQRCAFVLVQLDPYRLLSLLFSFIYRRLDLAILPKCPGIR